MPASPSSPAKPVAIYLRVSTSDQSHDSQRHEVDRWLVAQGIDPARCEWYVDTESGRTLDRPEFARMGADVERGRRKTIVVYRLDRISRDLLDGMGVLARWCRAGVRVASVTEHLDLSGTAGRIVAAVLLGMAEIEWSARRERQAAGIAAAKARGVFLGRARGTTKATPARAAELRARGLSPLEIATALGVSERTVYRYLA